MAVLSTRRRKKLRKSQFAGPGRTYPVHDRSHAISAKGFATRAYKRGRISRAQMQRIHAKANRVLKRKRK